MVTRLKLYQVKQYVAKVGLSLTKLSGSGHGHHGSYYSKNTIVKQISLFSQRGDCNDTKLKFDTKYSKICVKRPLKDKTTVLMTNVSLTKVERIAK